MKTDYLKWLYMLVLFLWAGLASPFVKFYSSDYPYIFIFNILFLTFYYFRYKHHINIKPFLIIFSIYLLWYAATCVKKEGLQPTDFTLVYSTLIAFVSFNVFNLKEFFHYYERVLVFLCVLSLIVWGSAAIKPSIFQPLWRSLAIYHAVGLENWSMLIVGFGEQYTAGILRNLGFAWEAGRYASFIVVGAYINMTIHNFELSPRKNPRFYIIFLTLLSTLSTTGLMAFFTVILYYAVNKSIYSKAIIVFLIVIATPTLISLSFLGEKIISNMDYATEISNMEWTFEHDAEASVTPQRITGFYLDLQNFIHDPWLGYNINENSYAAKEIFGGMDVWLSDGTIQILSKYGLFLGMFFYYNLIRVAHYIDIIYKKKRYYLFALLFIVISIGYDFWGTGLMLSIVLYPLFAHYNLSKIKYERNN